MKMDKDTPNSLAIIGASGTGKTVLAVGLYATSTPEFTVSPVGDETRKYIEVRQSALEEGYWPSATNESDNINLRLRLHAKGKRSDIVFREYMGELMEKDPNYIRDVIGTPKAEMVLFNPGMPGLKSAESRNKMIGNLKVIAQHLKDNKCAAVALVVTASDRLMSDLADFREDFEQYVSLITNHLGNLQLNWERFDVTVSGELTDQNKPRLAHGEDNTTHEPFLWLLDCIHTQNARRVLKKVLEWGVCVVVCASAIWGGLWAWSKTQLSKIESKTSRIESDLASAWKTKDELAVRNGLRDLEFVVTNTLPHTFAIAPANPETARRLAARLSDGIDLWGVRLLALEFESNRRDCESAPLNLQEGWAKKFDDRLNIVKPFETNAVAELRILRDKWGDARPGMEKQWQVAKLKREVEQKAIKLSKAVAKDTPGLLKDSFDFLNNMQRDFPLIENRDELSKPLVDARVAALDCYIGSISDWRVEDENRPSSISALRQTLKENLLGRIYEEEFSKSETMLLDKLAKASVAWDEYHFPKNVKKYESALKAAGANPSNALKASLSFLGTMTNDFPTIQQNQFCSARDAITQARAEALKSYCDLIESGWDVNGKTPPEFDEQEIRNANLTDLAVTIEEWNSFVSDIQVRLGDAKQQWDAHQQQLVDGFNDAGDVREVVRKYGEFIDENNQNPYLPKLHERISSRLAAYFKDYIIDYHKEFFGENRIGNEIYAQSRMERAQRRFNEFREVCLAVSGKGWSSSPLQDAAIGKFAKLCADRGKLQSAGITAAFEQTLRVTKVEVMFQPASLDSSYTGMALDCNLIANRWNFSSQQNDQIINTILFSGKTLSRSQNYQWVTLWSGARELRTNPWTFSSFYINCSENLNGTFIESKSGGKGFWLDFSLGENSDKYTVNVHFEHAAFWNDDTKGTLNIRVSYVGEGVDFVSLWKEAGLDN